MKICLWDLRPEEPREWGGLQSSAAHTLQFHCTLYMKVSKKAMILFEFRETWSKITSRNIRKYMLNISSTALSQNFLRTYQFKYNCLTCTIHYIVGHRKERQKTTSRFRPHWPAWVLELCSDIQQNNMPHKWVSMFTQEVWDHIQNNPVNKKALCLSPGASLTVPEGTVHHASHHSSDHVPTGNHDRRVRVLRGLKEDNIVYKETWKGIKEIGGKGQKKCMKMS